MRRAELGSAPQTAYPPAARSASPLARVAPQPRRPPVPAPALPTGALGGAGGRAAAGGSGGSGKAGPRPGGSMPGPSRLGLVPARPVWTQARWRGEAHERLRWPEVQVRKMREPPDENSAPLTPSFLPHDTLSGGPIPPCWMPDLQNWTFPSAVGEQREHEVCSKGGRL
ncbi:translation initiation factor IF-2-like isoform X3 [Camelus ferus]|uniref:Translation initiation factor IF-2-like isoform X3 n=1 Tax=Camelus ferus TaxID=419612 RepID=A0A8B8UDH9_CAMFR|nr:translation initiation factor IF-2-like isoform X3 [Camelus ferus]